MNWKKISDDEVFNTPSEQPGSPASYERDIEIRHRLFRMEKNVAESVIAASKAQIAAAKYAEDTAKWTKISAIAIMISVVIMAIGVYLN